jgi:hypothetical protein
MYCAYCGNRAIHACFACSRRACATHLRRVVGVPVCTRCRRPARLAAAAGLCAAAGVGVAWLQWH